MKKPGFGTIVYFVSGIWILSIGAGMIYGAIKGLRK